MSKNNNIKYLAGIILGIFIVVGNGCAKGMQGPARQNAANGPHMQNDPHSPTTIYDPTLCESLPDSNSCMNNFACSYFNNRFDANKGKCVANSERFKSCKDYNTQEKCDLKDLSYQECTYQNGVCESAWEVRNRANQNNAWVPQQNVPIQQNNAWVPQQNNIFGGQAPQVPVFNNIFGNVRPVNPLVDQDGFAPDGRHEVEVELAAGGVDAAQFIRLAAPQPDWLVPGHKARIVARLANDAVMGQFFALNPTFEQIWDLLTQNGGFETINEIEVTRLIKDKAVKLPFISGEQYARIMGEVWNGAFREQDYLQVNGFQIWGTAEEFIGIRNGQAPNFAKTLKDIEDVRRFLQNVPMPALIDNQVILDMVARIDVHVVAKKAHQKMRMIPRLTGMVRAKFQQTNPDLNGAIKYFQVRDRQDWAVDTRVHRNFDCSICMGDIDGINPHDHQTHKGYDCPEQQGAHTYVCDDCLKQYIIGHENDEGIIKCPVNGHDHELPVPRAVVAAALENDPVRMDKREIRTLKAYAVALDMKPAECGHPGCGNIIFQSEADANHHHATCDTCATPFCHKCKVERNAWRAHMGHPCIRVVRDDHILPDVPGIRPCVYCGKPVFRIDGCNYMICERLDHQGQNVGGCGGKFHWVKGKFRDGLTGADRHSFQNNANGLREYRVFGDPDYAEALETTFPGNGRLLSLEESEHAG